MAGETVIQNGLIVNGPISGTSLVANGVWTYKGTWSPSTGSYPAPVGLADGWFYDAITAGYVSGLYFHMGDLIRYNDTLAGFQAFSGVEAVGVLCAALAGLSFCASQIDYTPACAASWAGTDPTELANATDRLAAALALHTGDAVL